MISNLKVSDGDLLIVNIEGDVTQAIVDAYQTKIVKWCKARGLANVTVLVSTANSNITKITANDVFEDEVLKNNEEK